jgi:hypothetical protein
VDTPRPPLRTNRTHRVPQPVLIGHAASLTPATAGRALGWLHNGVHNGGACVAEEKEGGWLEGARAAGARGEGSWSNSGQILVKGGWGPGCSSTGPAHQRTLGDARLALDLEVQVVEEPAWPRARGSAGALRACCCCQTRTPSFHEYSNAFCVGSDWWVRVQSMHQGGIFAPWKRRV